MKVYHYTTIDSLAMIMHSHSIKFNRLDKVDDMEERAQSNGVKLWQYVFVSCWTENAEESIPLWRMYSGNTHGVRICLDVDMFADNIIGGNNVPSNIPHEGCFISKIQPKDIFRPDYFVLPIAQNNRNYNNDSLFYCHIEYVNDVNEKTKDAYQLTMTDNIHASTEINFGKIGKYKNNCWAFQQESRFRLLILPFNPILSNPDEVGTIAVKTLHQSIPLPISEFFLKLKPEALDNIEITLHPNASMSDKIIVASLCDRYAKNAVIKDSVLKDRVSLR